MAHFWGVAYDKISWCNWEKLKNNLKPKPTKADIKMSFSLNLPC